MKSQTTLLILIAFNLVLGTHQVLAAEDSKFDPKKPLQEPIKTQPQEGKADINVIGEEPVNSTAPVTLRAGPFSCDIHIANTTDLYINRIYINGVNQGGTGRFGDSLIKDVPVGRIEMCAEIDFVDGPTLHHGPIYVDCNSYATFSWILEY